MSSCALYPTVHVGNEEIESPLFRQIKDFTGSYNAAWDIWGLTKSPTYMRDKKVEYDENGEPTFESLSKAIDIEKIAGASLNGKRKTLGATDSKGNPVVYKTASEIVDKVIDFNKENQGAVATIHQTEKGYVIHVDEIDESSSRKAGLLVFNNELNNRLLGIMRSLGFNAEVNEELVHNGVFTPLTGDNTAEVLRTVIQIAKGQRGENAFPEEFSHWLIQGMIRHPLVQRLLNASASEEIQRAVLGETYDQYLDAYRGSQSKMQAETAGKLLSQHIVEGEAPVADNLISRIWKFFKGLFASVDENIIDKAMNEANEVAGQLADKIHDGSVVDYIDEKSLADNGELYQIQEETRSLQKIAEQALETASRRLKILQARSRDKRYDKNEVNQIKKLQALIDKKKYAKSCLQFLENSTAQIQELQDELKALNKPGKRYSSELERLRRISYILRTVKEFSEGYVPTIEAMESLEGLEEMGQIEGIDKEDAVNISEQASKLSRKLTGIVSNYKDLRYRAVYDFLKIYWGKDDKIKQIGKNKGEQVTLAMIMDHAVKDIGGIDRWVQSLSDASDPMLSLIDRAVKTSHKKRDEVLVDMLNRIRGVHKRLLDAGESSEFMYERDSDGNLTGRIISDIDFIQYQKDWQEYKDSLIKEGLKFWQVEAKMKSWENKHTELVTVYRTETGGRKERLPRQDMYHSNALESLNEAQRKYYNDMMELKSFLENMLPSYKANRYMAVQIRNDMVQMIGENWDNPKKLAKMFSSNLQDKFIRRQDDTEFGEEGKKGTVLLDFTGHPVNKLPIYYTSPLEDMNRLNTDFGSSLAAYASTVVNYNEMNKVIDVLELTKDFVMDREVKQYQGEDPIQEAFTVLHRKFGKEYTKSGRESRIGERLNDYYNQVIYNKKKLYEGDFRIPFTNKRLDKAKALDNIRDYTGQIGLGLNIFTALSNVTMGKMQILIESLGGEYYGYKNSINGKKKYYSMLPMALAEVNSVTKTSKLNLLMEKFDATEDLFSSSQRQQMYNSTIARIFGKGSMFFLMNAGEHYLRGRTMLSMLDAFRVYDNEGNEMALDDAFDVVEIKDDDGNVISAELKLREGIQDKDGNAVTESALQDYSLKIAKVNQSLNGAFGDDDILAIQKYALGRMGMQFRKWMPAHYNRRFASEYYDAAMEEWREGFYRTALRFNMEILKDLAKGKVTILAKWDELSNAEKANLKRAITEASMYYALSALLMMAGPSKDKKGKWGDRMILYNLHRMKLEAGASYPLNTEFLNNIWKLLQSPAASIKTFNNIANLVEFQNMFIEIESGRYAGWSKYERDVSLLLPVYGSARRLVDITEEDYMFMMFNK